MRSLSKYAVFVRRTTTVCALFGALWIAASYAGAAESPSHPKAVQPPKPTGFGTAFFVNRNGYLLTCDHVVVGASRIEIVMDDRAIEATIVAENKKLDLAVLKVDENNTTPLPLSDSLRVQLGEQVSVAGFPLGESLGQTVKVSSGTVSGLITEKGINQLQVDAAINPGNSGGPLINAGGEVIGVVNAKLVGSEITSIGFSIPVNYAQTMLAGERIVAVSAGGSSQPLTSIERARRARMSTVLVRAFVDAASTPKTAAQAPANYFNPTDGAALVYIPEGEFVMGDDRDAQISINNPKRAVKMSGYWIYKFDVTVAMYKKFCAATGRAMPPAPAFSDGWAWDRQPIVNVSWLDSSAYCEWAGAELPTTAQWEKAARGPNGLKYPWGNQFSQMKLWASVRQVKKSGTIDGGGLGVSPYGCGDMAGNVDQWCRDWYSNLQRKDIKPGEADPVYLAGEKKLRCIRGGSWKDWNPDYFQSAWCDGHDPARGEDNIGFRCVYRMK